MKKLLGYYNYTVILTYCGMLFAVIGIYFTLKGGYSAACLALMLAGVCDMFDGAVAGTKARDADEKRFGIQIDSLSDLVSFGVLPGLIVYCISGETVAAGIVSALFILCALIRLAYFNVLEENRQRETDGRRESYLGLPVTTIAVFMPALYIICSLAKLKNGVVLPILLGVFAVCFIVPLHVKKIHTAGKMAVLVLGIVEAVLIILLMAGVLGA